MEITFHVSTPATDLTLNKNTLTLDVGETETLRATVEPHDTTDTVTWSSNNTAVATVDSNGLVTAKAPGTTRIIAKAGDFYGDSCTVTVRGSGASEASVSGSVVSYGENDPVTIQLIEQGQSEAAYEAIVKGDATGYSIANVLPGTYTMKVMKQNHVTREYTVIVGTNPVVQDVEIWLLGDVNGDGTINVKDKKLIFNHLNDPSGALTGYALDVGDVNRDGTINVKDKKLIFNHLKGISLWS